MSTENIAEIQKALVAEKLVIGTDTVVKGLKNGSVDKVYVTANAPEIIKDDVNHYAKLNSIEVAQLDIASDELMEICKKRFTISLVARSR